MGARTRRTSLIDQMAMEQAMEFIEDELGLVFDATPDNLDLLAAHLGLEQISHVTKLLDEMRQSGYLASDSKRSLRPRRFYVIEPEFAF